MAPSLHPDADAIMARLKKEGITALYHFTSVENLPSICQMQAICSKQLLEDARKWPCAVPGGEGPSHALDRRNGNWNMVHLNFTPYTPMVYGKKQKNHLCFFRIYPQVATWQGVVFTDTNAASNNHLRITGLQGLESIHFDIINSIARGDKETWKRYVQAEILVPGKIPFEYVSDVVFVSRASMAFAEILSDSLPHPKFTVDERLFTDSPRAPKEAINLPYVKELLLTDAEIDNNLLQNMVYLSRIQKNIFSKKGHGYIKIVGLVRAITGTQASIILRRLDRINIPERFIGSAEFDRPSFYYTQHLVRLDELAVGNYRVEYFLNGIWWASTLLEIAE